MDDPVYSDLRGFLAQLERDGELRIVEAEVDPHLEIAEIHRRVIAADIHPASQRVTRHHVAYTAHIVIDARMKPPYPKELFCDDETAAVVGRRWREYCPDGGVEMGDSGRGHLV